MADVKELDGLHFEQSHGKARVRVARVWRTEEGRHFMVEWNVNITLFSDCTSAYIGDDNSDIVATDTMKNTVNVFPFTGLYNVSFLAIDVDRISTRLLDLSRIQA